MTTLTYAQLCQIERAAPTSPDARTNFIKAVMFALPATPTANNVADAIKSVLASPAAPTSTFGNTEPPDTSEPLPEPMPEPRRRREPLPMEHLKEKSHATNKHLR
jgi:hypothetical protein